MSLSEPLVKIRQTQLDDDYRHMEQKFDSLCFAEGAIQSFELNWDNFKEDRPLNVQTSIAHIIKQLMGQMNGQDLLRDDCRSSLRTRLDFLREKFMSREVRVDGLENLAAAADFKSEDRDRLKAFLQKQFRAYRANSEQWRAEVFDALVEPNLRAEKEALGLVSQFESLVRAQRDWLDSFITELEDKFKQNRDMALFTRLVRKSEEILQSYSTQADELKERFFKPLRKRSRTVLGRADGRLTQLATSQNRRFWSIMVRDFRRRDEGEKTCDYVDWLIESWTDSFAEITERIEMETPTDSGRDETLWRLLHQKQSSFGQIRRDNESLWKQAADEVAKLWRDQFPDEKPPPDSHEPQVDPADLEWMIVESTEDWPVVGESPAQGPSCTNPVREFLDSFYREMVGLEIGYSPVQAFVFGEQKYEENQKRESALRAEYGRVIEIIRAYKTRIDWRVWADLRGSMSGWEQVRLKWTWTLREMKEEWRERVETKRRTLLMQGARLQDIQTAIREHDRWLERLEDEDHKLFMTQVEGFHTVRARLSRKLRGFYRKQAHDLNLQVWKILDSSDWEKASHLREIGDRLVRFLSARDEHLDLGRWATQLTRESEQLGTAADDINQTHLDFWTKALLESDLYWEDLIRGIREENESQEVSTENRLRCYGDNVLDAAEEPLDLRHAYLRFVDLEVAQAHLVEYSWQFIAQKTSHRLLLEEFYRDWQEVVRRWKAAQFEKTLFEYLPGRQNFTVLIEHYLEAREEFARLRQDHQTEIKRRWILKNDSPKSLDQLTLLLEEVESSWRRNGISNDERLGSFKSKLMEFTKSAHRDMLDMARQVNRSLFESLKRELTENGSEGLSQTLDEVIAQSRVVMTEAHTRWRVHLDDFATHLQFDGQAERDRLYDSLKNEVSQENELLSSRLDALRPKGPDEPQVEFECSKDIIEEIEMPLLQSFQKMIYNEVALSTVRKVLWPVLGHTKRDKMRVWTAIQRHHQLWVERSRAYKVEMYEEVVELLLDDHPDLTAIFREWNERVNESVSAWKHQSHSLVSKYIESQNGTQIIAKIKARTENFINDAIEMDTQLQKHYFDTYFEKLPQLEMEIGRDFAKLAAVINLYYFFSLNKIIELYRSRNSTTTLEDPIYSVLDTVWKGILLWFNEGIPTVDEDHWKKTLVGSVRIIIQNKRKILGEHRELWDVLNKKFDLAGPDGSMEQSIDQGGKCDVFKFIRGPSID